MKSISLVLIFTFLLVFSLDAMSASSKVMNALMIKENVNKNSNSLNRESLVIDADSFYDPRFDYTTFSGRVTDRDTTTSVVKVSSESRNVKFFRAGDLVEFKIQKMGSENFCQGYVRSIEENYFIMYARELSPCFPKEEYFRRGTALIMRSEKLAQRVREASVYRASLINKKRDFMLQLNGINNGIWNFEERKVQVAAEYDQRIAEIEREKLKALENLLSRKNDEIILQRELAFRLDSIDKELDFYRIDKHEPLVDRWHLDRDLGIPVYERPEAIRPRRASGEKTID